MPTLPDFEALARLVPSPSYELPPAILSARQHIPPNKLEDTRARLVEWSRASLDQTPRQAYAFARIAAELGRTHAEAEFALLRALNRLGEFRAVVSHAPSTVVQFAASGDIEGAASAWCESAWAYTFIGDLQPALDAIAHARAATSSSLIHARCDWVHARILRDQSHYADALARLEQARERFQADQMHVEVLRCEREIAHTRILGERGAVLDPLANLRQSFLNEGCALDAALCDYFSAYALAEANRYAESLNVLTRARQVFAESSADFFAAWCDLWFGVVYRRLNRFDEALRALHCARDYFLAHHIALEVSACDINLGNTFYTLNRYDDALAHYQHAAASANDRATRLARIYTNIGLVYAKQGTFVKALDLQHRALEIATSKQLTVLAAHNHANLAAGYRQLGQWTHAIHHLELARATFAQQGMRVQVTAREIDLAEAHLARDETPLALTYLNRARDAAGAENLDSLIALCDHLLAQIAAHTSDSARAFALIERARARFEQHAQSVDAALCEVTAGEFHLQWNEIEPARRCFERARPSLGAGLPDYAWRVDYGLARCADAVKDVPSAREHYRRAIRTITTARSALVTEQLSNAFFARRQAVFADALAHACQHDSAADALEVIEASKARTFLTFLHALRRDWKPRRAQDDPYVAQLSAREKELRYALDTLRGRSATQTASILGEPLRGTATPESAALAELNALGQAYELVVTQLQLATTGLAGVVVPAPFALEKFRAAANTAFGADWTALDYYLDDETLTISIVTPTETRVERRTLDAYTRALLAQCTAPEPDLRELIYRGTLRGAKVPSSGQNYLRRLSALLLPRQLGARVIVSPHGALHHLPFHALRAPSNDAYLIEQHTLSYAPSLQSLQVLLSESADEKVARPLIVGVSDFGGQLRPLPSASIEVEAVQRAFAGRGAVLWDAQATRQKILELAATGELQTFDLLHWATHAILDRAAPHQSRVQLREGALTAMDILDLSLNARLVTLSACQTALGEDGAGDELVGLARAFFYAGARALLVTLWAVEDQPMAELTERFYAHLADGEEIALALRHAQIEMLRAGSPPYHWAAFAVMGRA